MVRLNLKLGEEKNDWWWDDKTLPPCKRTSPDKNQDSENKSKKMSRRWIIVSVKPEIREEEKRFENQSICLS